MPEGIILPEGTAQEIRGLSFESRATLGIEPAFRVEDEDFPYSLIRACDFLSARSSLAYIATGLMLLEIEAKNYWRGYAEDFADLRRQMGLDGSEWSRLKTVVEVLVIEMGIPDTTLGAIKDRSKLYELAKATRAKIKSSGGLTPEIGTVALKMAEEAPTMPRNAFMEHLREAQMPSPPGCLQMETKRICRHLGCPVPNGDSDPNCDYCNTARSEEEQVVIANNALADSQ